MTGISEGEQAGQLSLYMLFPLPISYGVWHTQGGVGGRRGGRKLRNRRAIVAQSCGNVGGRGQHKAG